MAKKEPKTIMVKFVMTKKMKALFDKYAQEKDTTLSRVLRAHLRDILKMKNDG